MTFAPKQLVTVEYDDGQNLKRTSCFKRAKVVCHIGCFVVVDIDEVGQRATIDSYVQPFVTGESLAARFGEVS